MLRTTAIIAAALAAGCSAESAPTFVDRCEKMIMAQIKTPATYERHSANSDADGNVIIFFDAQNQFGATTRSEVACRFKDDKLEFAIIDGEFVSESVLGSF